MNKLFLLGGAVSLGLALFGLIHHRIVSGTWFQWADLLPPRVYEPHHELLIVIALFIGVAFLVAAITDKGGKI